MQSKIILLIVVIFLFGGCSAKKDEFLVPVRDHTEPMYDLKECLKKVKNKKPIPQNKKIDKILVIKHENKMYLYKDNKIFETFPVSLSKESLDGHKVMDGDGKTPEGLYTINSMRCHERRYFAMYISYPNEKDKAVAKKLGVKTGGYVSMHGNPKWNSDGHGDEYSLKHDWTRGCVGVPNKTMDYLFDHVDYNTPIEIRP